MAFSHGHARYFLRVGWRHRKFSEAFSKKGTGSHSLGLHILFQIVERHKVLIRMYKAYQCHVPSFLLSFDSTPSLWKRGIPSASTGS